MTQLVSCGNPARAASELQTAVSLAKGTCGWFWYDLAVAGIAKARTKLLALEAAQKAIGRDPDLSDAYNALAVIYRELGQFD